MFAPRGADTSSACTHTILMIHFRSSKMWTFTRHLPSGAVAGRSLHRFPLRDVHNASSTSQGEAKIFYRWPTIKHFRLLSRCKLYQLVLMGLLLPPATVSYSHGGLSGSTLTTAYVAAGGTLSLLVSLSHIFTRVIGEMAYLPSTGEVRLSTLTFFGDRRDILVPPHLLLPLEDKGALRGLEVIGQSGVFRYSVRYGQIIDSELMNHLLSLNR